MASFGSACRSFLTFRCSFPRIAVAAVAAFVALSTPFPPIVTAFTATASFTPLLSVTSSTTVVLSPAAPAPLVAITAAPAVILARASTLELFRNFLFVETFRFETDGVLDRRTAELADELLEILAGLFNSTLLTQELAGDQHVPLLQFNLLSAEQLI